MTQVSAAPSAEDFRPLHAVAAVPGRGHAFLAIGRGETRPAAAGVILMFRRKERRAAPGAAVAAGGEVFVVFPREGRFSGFFPQHAIGLGREFLPPVFIRLHVFTSPLNRLR